MKTSFKTRVLSPIAMFLTLLLIVTALPFSQNVSANQSKYKNYVTGYTLTGNGAADMVAVAKKQLNRTGSQLGYSEGWCDNFVSDCAILCGQAKAVPQGGDVADFLYYLKRAGATEVSTPRAGDIVIFYKGTTAKHAGICINSSNCISGNMDGGGNVYISKVKEYSNATIAQYSGFSSYKFFRPKYATSGVVRTVTFNSNDGTSRSVKEQFAYGVSGQKFGYYFNGKARYNPMPAADVGFGQWVREGYKLLGWSTDPNATTAMYATYSGVNNTYISTSSTDTLYAVWQAIDPNSITPTPTSTPTPTVNPSVPTPLPTKVTTGYYYIRNVSTGRYLNVSGGTDANATNVITYNFDNTSGSKTNEIFYVYGATTSGANMIRTMVSSSRVLNAYSDTPVDGTNVNIYNCTNDKSQTWYFVATTNGYRIELAYNRNLVLTDVSNDAKVKTKTNSNNQIWELVPVTVEVTFDRNDGSSDTLKETFTYNVSNQSFGHNADGSDKYSVMADGSVGFGPWTRDGYRFLGWSADSNATEATYSVYSRVNNAFIAKQRAITLYAVWEKVETTTTPSITTEPESMSFEWNGETGYYFWEDEDTGLPYYQDVNSISLNLTNCPISFYYEVVYDMESVYTSALFNGNNVSLGYSVEEGNLSTGHYSIEIYDENGEFYDSTNCVVINTSDYDLSWCVYETDETTGSEVTYIDAKSNDVEFTDVSYIDLIYSPYPFETSFKVYYNDEFVYESDEYGAHFDISSEAVEACNGNLPAGVYRIEYYSWQGGLMASAECTVINTAQITPTPTNTPTATPTATVTPTVRPTDTSTPTPIVVPPTDTPTATPTVVPPTDTPTSTPTEVPPTDTPTAAPTVVTPVPTTDPSESPIEAFAERLYTCALRRASDPEGKAYWVAKLESGANAAEIAHSYLFSQEVIDDNISDADFIDRLYRTFMDREGDESGINFWLNNLANGATRESIFRSFVNSQEWANVCYLAGINSGSTVRPNVDRPASQAVIDFATRLYTTCLCRDGEESGIEYWSTELANGRTTGTAAAHGFFFSGEFISENVDDEEFINRLYRTFMGREADESGLNYWLNKMGAGASRESVFNGFATSSEFADLCRAAGITP